MGCNRCAFGVRDRASISEADWKVYKRFRPCAQDRHAQRVLDEADRIRQDETLTLAGRFGIGFAMRQDDASAWDALDAAQGCQFE